MSEKQTDAIQKPAKNKNLAEIIGLSVLCPLIVFIVVPIEIYASNMEEFQFSLGDFVFINILLFLVFSAINFVVLFFTRNRFHKMLKGLSLATALLLFVQGSYLNVGLNSLIGDNLVTSNLSGFYMFIDIMLWMIIIAVFVILGSINFKTTILSTISLLLTIVLLSTQIISPISVFASHPSAAISATQRMKNEGEEFYILSTKGLDTLSSSNNVYYFCVDRFDELFAERVTNDYPDLYSELTGFTWFQDYISLYSHTYPAVASMLTNKEYDISKLRVDFLNDVYSGETALSKMNENGYSVQLYTDSYYSFSNASHLPEYVTNRSELESFNIHNRFGLSCCMTGLSLYRCLPYGAKELFAILNSGVLNSFVDCTAEDGHAEYKTLNKNVQEIVSNASFSVDAQKQFSFIHVEGCHDIQHINYHSGPIKLSFDIINCYLRALKANGLYDSATIIITGDHPDGINDTRGIGEPRLTSLFVKPSNSTNEPLKISQAQVSQVNLWPTIFKSENIAHTGEPSVFDIDESEDRIRYHYFDTYVYPLTEYTYRITGSGKQFDNWEQIDEVTYDRILLD